MGMPILVYGKSGSGKSRSLKFFGENEILLVNIEGNSCRSKIHSNMSAVPIPLTPL